MYFLSLYIYIYIKREDIYVCLFFSFFTIFACTSRVRQMVLHVYLHNKRREKGGLLLRILMMISFRFFFFLFIIYINSFIII